MSVSSPSPALTKSCSGSLRSVSFMVYGTCDLVVICGRQAPSFLAGEKSRGLDSPLNFTDEDWNSESASKQPSRKRLKERRWCLCDAHGKPEDGAQEGRFTEVPREEKPPSFSRPVCGSLTSIVSLSWRQTLGWQGEMRLILRQSYLPTGSMRRVWGGATVFSDRC